MFRVEVYIEVFATYRGNLSCVPRYCRACARRRQEARAYGGRSVEVYRPTVLSDYNMARGSGRRGVWHTPGGRGRPGVRRPVDISAANRAYAIRPYACGEAG